MKPVKVSQGSTYSELLSVIEEMSREIRPTYAGSKSAMERLKRGRFYLLKVAFWQECKAACQCGTHNVCVWFPMSREQRANQNHMN